MGQTVLEQEEALEWAAGLQALHERIAGRFGRREPRRRALAYPRGLLGSVERKTQEWVAAGRVCRRRHARRGAAPAGHVPLGR